MRHHLFLIASLLFSATAFAGFKHPTSIAVQPLRSADEPSQKISELLRQKLREKTSLHVVDSEKASAILKNDQNQGRRVKELLSQAKEHYFQLAFPEAEAELNKVIELFRSQPDLIFKDGQGLVDSWMTLGLLFSAKREEAKAIHAFQEVLRLAPNTELNTEGFSPSIRKLFESARTQKEGTTSEKAALVVQGEPPATEIYLNGIYQGVSPLTLSALPAGEYYLSFRASNYRSFEQWLRLEAGETMTLQHKLYWEEVSKQKGGVAESEIDRGVGLAELLKVDKVLLVDVQAEIIKTRLIDRSYRAGHRPIFISIKKGGEGLEENIHKLVRLIFAQTQLNLLKNPQAYLDPNGIGDPILLGGRRGTTSKKILLGSIGAMGLGGVLAVLFSAGGSSGPDTGSLAIQFK